MSIFNYLFAKDIPGANIKVQEQAVLKCRNPEFSYQFVKDIPGADMESHQKVIIENGISAVGYNKYIYLFAANIPGADIKALAAQMNRAYDEHYICLFNQTFNGMCDEYYKNKKEKEELQIINCLNEKVKKLGSMKSVK